MKGKHHRNGGQVVQLTIFTWSITIMKLAGKTVDGATNYDGEKILKKRSN